MAKLVDALCSGRSVRKDVLVRIQFWARVKAPHFVRGFFYGCDRSLLLGADSKKPQAHRAIRDFYSEDVRDEGSSFNFISNTIISKCFLYFAVHETIQNHKIDTTLNGTKNDSNLEKGYGVTFT